MKKNAMICLIITLSIILSVSGKAPVNTSPDHRVRIVRDTMPDGDIEVYATIDSVKQGYWIYYNAKGFKEMDGTYVDGKLNGPFNIYYEDGQIGLATYKIDQVSDGESISYFENGNIKEKTMIKMGMRDGISEWYVRDGSLDKKLLFRNDTLIRILIDNHIMPLPPLMEPLEK